jgi:hypothetical protein
LKINPIKTKSVFVDNAIDAAIAAFAKLHGSIFMRTAIPHSNQQIDNDTFK